MGKTRFVRKDFYERIECVNISTYTHLYHQIIGYYSSLFFFQKDIKNGFIATDENYLDELRI